MTPEQQKKPNRSIYSNRRQNQKQSNRNRFHTAHRNSFASKKLRIIPLGGMEEVGKNMTLFEYGNDIIILDMGLQFPEESMHGIDYIIPNISYLKGKEKNIKAVIFSHGHMDHVGAAPILLDNLGYPTIVGRPLTLAMIKHRQEDYRPNSTKNLKTLTIKKLSDRFTFGSFKVSFFQVDHSIMDAVGIILETPSGSVIHPGDWTLEKGEDGKPIIDYSHLRRIKKPSILMLESLGAIDIRKSASHKTMRKNIEKLIREAPSRVIVGTFASQIERINWIIGEAEKLGKKVALDGYSIKINIEIAQKLGYIKVKKGTLVKINQIDEIPEDKLVVIATGAQGEGNAVLSRIITGSHKYLKLKKNDTVILSSSVIPGNENTIQRLKDELYRQCDNVIHGEIMDIHVSGHGNREDITHILNTVKPDYFIPVYAYHYMLRESAKLAKEIGFNEKNIIVLDNGQVAEFYKSQGQATKEKVDTSNILVDGLGIGDVGNVVLRDRQVMASDGMIVVVVQINTKTKKVQGSPDIITRGFIHIKTSEKLMRAIRERIKKSAESIISKQMPKKTEDWGNVKAKIREDLSSFLFKETEREPMVLPVVLKI
jgi:ribonuclease J